MVTRPHDPPMGDTHVWELVPWHQFLALVPHHLHDMVSGPTTQGSRGHFPQWKRGSSLDSHTQNELKHTQTRLL